MKKTIFLLFSFESVLNKKSTITNRITQIMIKIDIICVGKIKESFYRDAVSEYSKRLSRYCTLSVYETADEKTPDKASDTEIQGILSTEADRINALLDKPAMQGAYIITLEINGKQLSSEELASKIEKLSVDGVSHILFIIGGSLGLHNSVISRASFHLSFSKMTFPHQLMRVVLLEQIYRGFRIINHEPYHK